MAAHLHAYTGDQRTQETSVGTQGLGATSKHVSGNKGLLFGHQLRHTHR